MKNKTFQMSTHTAIATTAKGQFDVIQVPTEAPGEGEILVKVEYSSLAAIDTYVTDHGFAVASYPTVLGMNVSGTVVKLGAGVDDLVEGDRVAALGQYTSHSRGMQEYSLLARFSCAKIPDSTSLDVSATLGDNFITAFYTIFDVLQLPVPSSFPASSPPPLASKAILIYGAGSTTGQYAVQLLHIAGYKNIIATASPKNHDYLRSLGATSTFDYRSPDLVKDIAAAAGGDGKITLAFDCVAMLGDSLATIGKVISPQGSVAFLLPVKIGTTLAIDNSSGMLMDLPKDKNPLPEGTTVIPVNAFNYQANEFLRSNLMPKILPSLLESGILKPNRIRLIDQGTFKERVAKGLDLLRNNKLSAEKVVVKVRA